MQERTMVPTLITIPLSHYCERARWALDWSGIPYAEEHQLQGFSRIRMRRLGARPGTVPALVLPEKILGDSCAIVRYASERAGERSLYPAPLGEEIRVFEQTLVQGFGVETRRWAYDWFLACFDEFVTYNSGACPAYQHAFVKLAHPWLGAFIRRRFSIGPAEVEGARDCIARTFDSVAKRLDGRRFLFGDSFSAADLTFASLAALCLSVPHYGVPFPDPRDARSKDPRVDAAATWIGTLRDHAAGRHALAIYAAHRPVPRGGLDQALRASTR